MVTDLYQPNLAYDRYWWALSAAYSNGYRIYDPDFATKQDIDIEEKIRRDPIIVQAMTQRFRAAAGGDYTVQPWSDREDDVLVAAIIADLLKEITNFPTARYNLAQGVMDSRSFAKIQGRRSLLRAGPEDVEAMEWWYPTILKDIDQRRMYWRPRDGERGDVELWTFDVQTGEQRAVGDRRTLIEVVFEDQEARLGYGRGLKEAIYHYHWAKAVVLREGLQGLERWAQGWTIAKIDTSKHGTDGQTTQQIVDAYLSMLRDFRAKYGAMAIDKDDEVDTIFPGEGGGRMVIDFLQYLDDSLTRVIFGSLLPTGGGGEVGSLARAEVESDTSESVVEFDRNVLDASLTRDVIGLIWDVNRENFSQLGISGAHMPTFKTTAGKTTTDPEKNIEVISQALQSGIPLLKAEVYERLDMTPPSEDDEVLRGRDTGDPLGLGSLESELGLTGPAGGATDDDPAPENTNADGDVMAGGEEIAAGGVEPPTMQELSLAYERAIKNGDRATANLMRRKLWAVTGESAVPPDITDAEWDEMTGATETEPVGAVG